MSIAPLNVVSWNLNGLDVDGLDRRMEAAAHGLLMRQPHPEVLLFQEVVDRGLHAHLRRHLGAVGYGMAQQPPTGSYYVAAFVRAPAVLTEAAFYPLGGRLGRGMLVLDLTYSGQAWRVGTAHFESGPREGDVRIAQTTRVLDVLGEHSGPALFAGDTNLRDRELKDRIAARGWSDAWLTSGGAAEHAGTWAPARGVSPMRLFRFDRAWVNEQVKVTDFCTIAKGVTGDGHPVTVSDHKGLAFGVCAAPLAR
jgi:endonuclease/exonuclease/phosphatase family metal-dependent hydrolase